MLPNLPDLPIAGELPRIRAALAGNANLVITAPPGAGKTTIVPLALLEEPWLAERNIILLQPRRVAALTCARRMAALHGSPVGRTVGYQVRFQRCLSRDTRIEVLTEGLLTRRLQTDPLLEGVGLLIFDEFHERSLHADLGLALSREIQREVRPDLRLIVMSATLSTDPVARFLGDCPVVASTGFLFPVTCTYVGKKPTGPLWESAAAAVRRTLADDRTSGDILVFLPGAGEIARTRDLLEEAGVGERCDLLPLHGSLSLDQQEAVLRPGNRRRVILATNIAETSLTIEGITTVIDSGWGRTLRLDPHTGLERLVLERITRDSSEQRAGRAGRLGPGQAIRLWPESEQAWLTAHADPEIRRVDLAGVVLELAAWGVRDPIAFGWFDPPPSPALTVARTLLARLGAIDAAGNITPLGRQMARLPVNPRVARMLLAAGEIGLLNAGADLAALLSERDLFKRTPGLPGSGPGPGSGSVSSITTAACDLFSRLDALERWRRGGKRSSDPFIDTRAAQAIDRTADQLRGILEHLAPSDPSLTSSASTDGGPRQAPNHRLGPGPRTVPCPEGSGLMPVREERLLRLLLLGFPDRVGRRRDTGRQGESDPTYVLVGGRGMRLAPACVVRDAPLVLALSADADGRGGADGLIHQAARLEPVWLSELFPADLVSRRVAVFDEARGTVLVRRQQLFHDLVLEDAQVEAVPEDRPAIEQALVAAAVRNPRKALAISDEDDQFLWRVALYRRHFPDRGWPLVDEDWLRSQIPALALGARRWSDLRRQSVREIVAASVSHQERRRFEAAVPEHLVVPTGSRIRLRYQSDGPPILAVKLQEMFGSATSPMVCEGRERVVVHLLSPAARPLQITQDLAGFWRDGYQSVRAEMRGRYPRHPWPEDPASAPPQRGVKHPRRSNG
jgi:ATP-dependent helicase HrpB